MTSAGIQNLCLTKVVCWRSVPLHRTKQQFDFNRLPTPKFHHLSVQIEPHRKRAWNSASETDRCTDDIGMLLLAWYMGACMHSPPAPGAVMFMYACMILSIFLASGQGTTGWALKFKSYNTSSMNESLGSVRFSYYMYFSACFFSRNSVFLSQQIS